MRRFANCEVVIALTQVAALITGYWQPTFDKISVPGVTALLLTSTMLSNTVGVRVSCFSSYKAGIPAVTPGVLILVRHSDIRLDGVDF